MIRFFIYKFLKTVNLPYEKLNIHSFDPFIKDKTLTSILLLKKEFQLKWREKVGNIISNEIYKIHKFKKLNCTFATAIYLNLYHSFIIKNLTVTRKCKEELNYIILIKNKKILYILNEEEDPVDYNKILFNKVTNIDSLKSLITIKESLEDEFKNIDDLFNTFSDTIMNKQHSNAYRSNFKSQDAISYARKYALITNKNYLDFTNSGGDCTNFISQCVHAGGVPLSYIWKPYSNTWLRVNELYYYLLRKGFAEKKSNIYSLSPSDIIQFYSDAKGFFAHSCIVTEVFENGDALYCCHSYNKLDYPLSETYPRFYKTIRILTMK